MPQISVSNNGTNTVITGGGSASRQKICVSDIVLIAAGTGTIKFQSWDGSVATDLTGAMDVTAAGGFSAHAASPDVPLLETKPGESLRIVSTITVNGTISYFKDV